MLFLVLLGPCIVLCSCRSSSPQAEPPASTGSAGAVSEPAKDAVAQSGLSGDDLPPVLKTSWKGDLDELAKRRAVRVLVPFRRPEFFYMQGKPAGVLMEAFREIESILNAKYKTTAANRIVVVLLPTPVDKIRERMEGGYGDIAAGSISITDQNKAIADFTIPTMTGVSIIPVTGPGAPAINSIDDLSGKEVWVMPGTRMKKDLEDLNARFASQGKAPAIVRETDPVLEPGDVMELVNTGVYQIALLQSVQADFWAQVFDNIKVRKDIALAQDVELAWAIQKNTPQLKTFLDDFIKTHGIGTSFGNTVMRRYLKDAKYVKNATNKSEMEKFRATLPHFKKYSAQYNMNYLLLAARGTRSLGLTSQ